jgi:hypothetical protein
VRRFPIYVNGEIALARITQALTDAGFHVRCDVNGMTVVDEVPHFVRREAPGAKVMLITKAARRK